MTSKLILGEAAPWFRAPTPSRPDFAFSSLGGRYVLLGFLPPAGPQFEAAQAWVSANRALFNDHKLALFLVARDPAIIGQARDEPPGLRWFFDPDGQIARLYGMAGDGGDTTPGWILTDPGLRLMSTAPFEALGPLLARLRSLPAIDQHAGAPLHAPVLVVPRIFEPQICQRLIDLYEAQGGQVSGVMREVDGRTVGVVDDFKKRRDADVDDEAFRNELRVRIKRRLLPEIQKAFQFEVTRMERYIVACYDAQDGGYFRAHRDNTTKGTAHRRFAVSINLNAEAFEGGDLRFPEFGTRTYRPPTGGAVVFSCSLLHEATPVTKGRRYAFLPFLYDEAAAEIRDQNQGFLDISPAPAARP